VRKIRFRKNLHQVSDHRQKIEKPSNLKVFGSK